jgi:hypothetical protein
MVLITSYGSKAPSSNGSTADFDETNHQGMAHLTMQ